MQIKVLGSGCKTCKQLQNSVNKAVSELGLEVEVEYVDDVQAMLDLGVMAGPVLVIDDAVVSAGQVPSFEKIKQFIADSKSNVATPKNESKKNSNCGCGSCCCKK